MKNTFIKLTCISIILFLCFTICNLIFEKGIFLTLSITFGTITYHFGMRLFVGYVVNKIMKNKADYSKKRYQISKIETHMYELLKVQKWKNKMPTFDPELFSLEKHSWDEIAQAMCQAEVVHEIIIILSYFPIVASIFWGDFPVFLITSICASLVDFAFVIMQRYNRPRIVKLAKKYKQK